MSFPNPFSADFWVMPEPPDNVIHLNTAHARANAAQAARLLEDDRAATRRELLRRDLMRERRELEERIERIDAAIVELC